MPESPDTNLEKIKKKGKENLKLGGAELAKYEEEPIAFGLKAIIAYIRLDEKIQDSDFVEQAFKVPGASSVEIIDYRRAVE